MLMLYFRCKKQVYILQNTRQSYKYLELLISLVWQVSQVNDFVKNSDSWNVEGKWFTINLQRHIKCMFQCRQLSFPMSEISTMILHFYPYEGFQTGGSAGIGNAEGIYGILPKRHANDQPSLPVGPSVYCQSHPTLHSMSILSHRIWTQCECLFPLVINLRLLRHRFSHQDILILMVRGWLSGGIEA